MSATNDELVRTSFDAFLAGDWEALSQVMAPDAQWLWHEPGDWDCHDRRKVLATLLERQREGVFTALDQVVAIEDRVFVHERRLQPSEDWEGVLGEVVQLLEECRIENLRLEPEVMDPAAYQAGTPTRH